MTAGDDELPAATKDEQLTLACWKRAKGVRGLQQTAMRAKEQREAIDELTRMIDHGKHGMRTSPMMLHICMGGRACAHTHTVTIGCI